MIIFNTYFSIGFKSSPEDKKTRTEKARNKTALNLRPVLECLGRRSKGDYLYSTCEGVGICMES